MDADVAAVLVLLFVLFAALQIAVDEWVMAQVAKWFGREREEKVYDTTRR